MEAPRTHQEARHCADRAARELYRFYQPVPQADVVSSWVSAGDEYLLSSALPNAITPPISEGLGRSDSTITSPPSEAGNRSISTATSQPGTSTVGSDSLILGTSNTTLTSFAQLAALRLNVERVIICVLDRDEQHIVAEATQSLSLNDPSVHDAGDNIWLGTPDTRKAWNLCQVSLLTSTSLST